MSRPLDRHNVCELLDANLEAGRTERLALVCGHEALSYGELHARVCRAARLLRSLGLEREQRLLLVLDDGPQFVVSFLAALRLAAIPVPLGPYHNPDAYEWFGRDSGAPLAVVEGELEERVRPALERAGVRVMAAGTPAAPADFERLLAEHEPELEITGTHKWDPAFWLYTSGTTGRPKAAVHLHDAPRRACGAFGGHVLGLTEEDRCFSTAKLCHAYGLGNSLYYPLAAGATAVLLRGRPGATAIVATLTTTRPTVLFSLPSHYRALVDAADDAVQALRAVRLAISAGEQLPASLWQDCRDRLGLTVLDGVGSTEMLQTYCSNTRESLRPGSSGRAVPGYELRVVDGELQVKGPTALAHYWHAPARTHAAFCDGWFRTGDRYSVDADGFHWFEGRTDDMIKVSGLWVSPLEVEAVIAGHPAVAEAAVVGAPRAELMQVFAYVVPRETAARGPALAAQLRDWCKDRLQRHQYPRVVELVDALPRTASGKVRRAALRELAARDPA